MKIAYITDTHLGARNSSRIFRQLFREYYFEELFPALKDAGVEAVIHAGDFFDSRNAITLSDIDFIINEFIPEFDKLDISMYVIAGNHDVAHKNTNKINSLSLLKSSKNIHIIDDEVFVLETPNRKIVLCPWINNENSEKLFEELKFHEGRENVLVGHFEIQGAKMYKTSKVCEHGLKEKDFRNFGRVLSGHFHHSSDYGCVHYLGSLFHFNWLDYNDWRGYTIFDDETNEYEKVENEFCLFTELDYHEDIPKIKDDIKDFVEGQFVRLTINSEYKKVELKEILHLIESYNPVSLDIIDNTLFEAINVVSYDDNNDEEGGKGLKELSEYFVDYLEEQEIDKKVKKNLSRAFSSIHESALERMKDVE